MNVPELLVAEIEVGAVDGGLVAEEPVGARVNALPGRDDVRYALRSRLELGRGA